MAQINPARLNDSSVLEHNANPSMIGINDSVTKNPVFSPAKYS